jgi:hypothetical protein
VFRHRVSWLSISPQAVSGKAIPNELENEGEETFFDRVDPASDDGFSEDDLLPGDQIWIKNPYYREPRNAREEDSFSGEEGSNIFYVGDGLVISI